MGLPPRLPLLGAVALSAAVAAQAPARAAELSVTVAGVRSARGVVRLCVFAAPQGFPDCAGNGDARHLRAPASRGVVEFDIPDLAPGTYAASAYHDENGNGRLDRTLLGLPREGVGVSNNPRSLFGPPSFRQAAFRLLPAGGHIVIELVYP